RTYWYGNAFIKMKNLQMKGTYPSSFGKVWNMSDPAMGHRTGKLIENVWVVEPQQDQLGHMSFGPYEKGMEIGTWVSTWSMKLKNSSESKEPVLRLEIYDADTGEIIQQKNVYQEQFIINHFQDLNIQFRNEHPGHALEFRVYWCGKHAVELKSIRVNKTRVLDEYVYDKNGRLIHWNGVNGRHKYYRYDKNGNMLSVIDME
ncbi:RHS repeat protein, partial [Paenibacillus alvei]